METKANTSKDEWYTPIFLVKMVKEFFNNEIHLDPCCARNNPEHTESVIQYRKEDEPLHQSWIVDNVYCNPPYSETYKWVNKCVREYLQGNAKEVLLLVKCDPSVRWWQQIFMYPMAIFKKRLYFNDGKKSAPFPSALVYLGPREKQFINTFKSVCFMYINKN